MLLSSLHKPRFFCFVCYTDIQTICRAGCDAHLYERIVGVMRNTKDNAQKLRLFSEYLQRILRQHISSLLNNDLRSNHALYTAKYIEQAKFTVCRDLRHLIQHIAPGMQNFMRVLEDGNARQNSSQRRGGHRQQSSTFSVKDEAYAQVSAGFRPVQRFDDGLFAS